ncbi:MAG: hypothetical protein KatS3mg069_1726 [Meiothermus sp.]|nr:MAG: hypothetical protein KatS3mg069_1726 [Meiothermus sp.]
MISSKIRPASASTLHSCALCANLRSSGYNFRRASCYTRGTSRLEMLEREVQFERWFAEFKAEL